MLALEKVNLEELFYSGGRTSKLFNIFMSTVTIISIISTLSYDSARIVTYKPTLTYKILESIIISIFIMEYILKLSIYLKKLDKITAAAVGKFIIKPVNIIDVISFIPYFSISYPQRLTILVARIIKLPRFIPGIKTILDGLKESMVGVGIFFIILFFIIFSSSIMIFSIEHNANPHQFKSMADAVWWSIVTITTVGYGDIYPISTAGRILASIVMIIGISSIAILTSIISSSFTDKLLQKLKYNREAVMEKSINKLKNHFVLCGFGRVGKIVAKQLAEHNKNFVIIERTEDAIQHAQEQGYLTIYGDATNEEILAKAHINRAQGIALLMESDAKNLYSLITAKDENKNIFAVVRTNTEESIKKFKKLGAKTISLYQASAAKISQMLITPAVADFISITFGDDQNIEIGECFIKNRSKYAEKKIKDTDIRSKLNIIIIAIVSKTGEYIFNPKADNIIYADSTLICIGKKKDMSTFKTGLEL